MQECARARAQTHTLTHSGSRVRKALSDSPAKLLFLLQGPTHQTPNRKRAEPMRKKIAFNLEMFYPLIYPITLWEE